MFEGTMFTNGSGTPMWARLLLLCGKNAIYSWPLRCSHSGRGHLLQRGTFTARNFQRVLLLLKDGWSNQSWNYW